MLMWGLKISESEELEPIVSDGPLGVTFEVLGPRLQVTTMVRFTRSCLEVIGIIACLPFCYPGVVFVGLPCGL